MPEYAGYVSPEVSVDWGSSFAGLAQKITDVGTNIKKEREALDSLKTQNEALVNSYQPGKSQTLNEMVLRGANEIRAKMKYWNDELKAGRLKPEDYKTNMANVQEYWGTLANSAKTFDERFQASMDRQQPDENGNIPASSFEMELLNRFGQMADIGDNSVQVGGDGRLYMVKKDKNTGAIVGDIMDIRTMNSPDNIVSNRINLNTATNALVGNWDVYSIWKDAGKGSEINIEDIRQNPVFAPMKAQVAETIAPNSNPRAQISILTDNGVMDAIYYESPEEYKQKRQEAIDEAIQVKKTAGLPMADQLTPDELKKIEFNMVKIAKDDKGIINPILNEAQQKAAKDRVMQEVEMQLGKKVTGTPREYSTGRTAGGNNQNKGDEVSTAGAKLAQDAFSDTVPVGASSASDSTGVLTSIGAKNPGYRFKKVKWPNNKIGIAVFKYDKEKKDWITHQNILNARDLAPYIYGTTNVDKALSTYDEAVQQGVGTTEKFN